MKKKLLPIGAQDFASFKENNYIYVDKTENIYRLVTEGRYYFLSRPRRFGKSLLVSTLKELFEGNRVLFEGLWIEDKWNWSKTNPVIHISFAKIDYQGIGLENAINQALEKSAAIHEIILLGTTIKSRFEELLQVLSAKKGKVVVLIDEYDKPIIDFLEEALLPKAKEHRNILKAFYSVLKDSEPHLHFLLITGVSKFSQVSIFSDLNHLDDISIDNRYALMLGYTQQELEFSFKDYITESAKKIGLSPKSLLKHLKEWYNGYSWDGKNTVYNPFGILNFFAKQEFRNYWFTTGTPTFLMQLMQQQTQFEFDNLKTNVARIEKYDLEDLDLTALLFQTGYLTIRKRNYMNGDILLEYPNREIRESMYAFMLDSLKKRQNANSGQMIVKDLALAFQQNNLNRVKDLLESMFGDLPENLYETNDRRSERFYHSFIHLTFKFLGIYIKSEVATAKGYADSVVQTPTHVYIFEFKHQETAEAAMSQLLDKNYAQKYVALNKTIVVIGVNFDKTKRIIEGWEVKILKP